MDYEELMEEIGTNFKKNFGNSLRYDINTNFYKTVSPIGLGMMVLDERLEAYKRARNAFEAEGEELTLLLNDDGTFPRKQETKSRTEWVTTDSVAGTVIEKGAFIVEANNGVYFQNLYEHTITQGSNSITMQSITTGSITNVEANSLINKTTNIVGIGEGSNPSAATGGGDYETDDEYFKRFKNTKNNGSWNRDALISAILNAGADSCNVIENDTEVYMSLGTEPDMPPFSKRYYVRGGDPEEVAQGLNLKRDGGILETMGSDGIEIFIDDINGKEQKIVISYAVITPIYCYYEIEGGDPSYLEELINSYVESVTIGGEINMFACLSYVQSYMSVDYLYIKFSKVEGEDFATERLKLEEYEGGTMYGYN